MLKLKEFYCPIKKLNGSLALLYLDNANLFEEHFSSIFTPHLDVTLSTTQLVKINNYLDTPLHMFLRTKHISLNEISNEIHRLKPNKPTGNDLVANNYYNLNYPNISRNNVR